MPAPGNRTVAKIKSSSLQRASQVSDTSDVYIIPTPPWSVSSYRESDSNTPISLSYIRETEFLGQIQDPTKSPNQFSELQDEDDSAFLPDSEDDSEGDDGYENSEFLQQMSGGLSKSLSSAEDYEDVLSMRHKLEIEQNHSLSSTGDYDDILSVRHKLDIEQNQSGLSVNTTSIYHNLSDAFVSDSSTTETRTRGDKAADNPMTSSSRSQRSPNLNRSPQHPKPQPRQRTKPIPQPRRRSTISSTSSDVTENLWLSQSGEYMRGQAGGGVRQRTVTGVPKTKESKRQETDSGVGESYHEDDEPSLSQTTAPTKRTAFSSSIPPPVLSRDSPLSMHMYM